LRLQQVAYFSKRVVLGLGWVDFGVRPVGHWKDRCHDADYGYQRSGASPPDGAGVLALLPIVLSSVTHEAQNDSKTEQTDNGRQHVNLDQVLFVAAFVGGIGAAPLL